MGDATATGMVDAPRSALTSEAVAVLRAPFPADQIKVKPQTVTKDLSKGLVTFYVDSRLVAHRLDEAVGAEAWSDSYKVIAADPGVGIPVECSLTVCGVTKVDVGQIAPAGEKDDKMWKSAYSDAFKRAAVKFGVGAYLYDSPNVWAEIKVGGNGKAQGFSDAGKQQAFDAYRRWTAAGAPAPAGVVAEVVSATAKAAEAAANVQQQKKLDRLIANLTTADNTRDWAADAANYCLKKLGTTRDKLTREQIDQLVQAMTKKYDELTAKAAA